MERIIERLLRLEKTRIVAFGSSNTAAKNAARFNWVDWLDFGLARHYGRVHTTVNTGLSGNLTRDLLVRFDDDVALYEPHAVFITVGGNDASPERDIDEDEFRADLTDLVGRVAALGARPILQTYYSFDVEKIDPRYAENFFRYMDVVRTVAVECGATLVDHLKRWELLRVGRIDRYRELMADPLHVNPLGNMLMGLDLLRLFRAQPETKLRDVCADGLALQELLDSLQRGTPGGSR